MKNTQLPDMLSRLQSAYEALSDVLCDKKVRDIFTPRIVSAAAWIAELRGFLGGRLTYTADAAVARTKHWHAGYQRHRDECEGTGKVPATFAQWKKKGAAK